MIDTLVSLTKKFISIPSVSENAEARSRVLRLALSNLKGYTVERFMQNGIESALVYYGKKRPSKFKILLNGHLDVVPGNKQGYVPRIQGNRLYGVGSMDMKANVACLIMAFKDIAKKASYPIGLQLTTDEEVGGFDGTKHQIEKGVRADFVIAGEPTNFDIVHEAKGVLQVQISTHGKTAHGAYPWRGKNAIWNMHEFLSALRQRYPIPLRQAWVTTVNVSNIETNNTALNKIPDDCSVFLDVRYIPQDAKTVVSDIKKLLPRGFTMNVIVHEPVLSTDVHDTHLALLQSVSKKILRRKIIVRGAQGSSDARHFARVHCPGVEFGPIGGGIGGDDEWVSISSLKIYCDILKEFLLSYK